MKGKCLIIVFMVLVAGVFAEPGLMNYHVQEVVQEFVEEVDEGVTADDVVQFVNGHVLGSSLMSPESVFNSATTEQISAAALSDSKFVVAYCDQGNSSYGTAIVGTVSGPTITWGGESVFNSAATWNISVAALSDAKFVVAYQDAGNSSYGTAIVGTVSGTTISSWGGESVFNSASTGAVSAAALSDSAVVVTYRDYGNSSYGTAIVGTVSGSNITWGSADVFNSATTSYISAAALSASAFVVAYRDEGNSNYGTAMIGTVSGDTISAWGSEYEFNSADTTFISAAALSASTIVVAYRDVGNSDYGTAAVGLITGTTIFWGSEYQFNSAGTSPISAAALSDTKFVVAYSDVGNSDYGTATVGTVSGNSIAWDTEDVFNSAATWVISAAALSDTKFVVAYQDHGNSDYGTATVGTADPWGGESVFNSAGTYPASAAALSDTTFVVAYHDEGNPNRGTAIVGTVSGSTITWGTESVFGSLETHWISAVALSDTKFVVAYQWLDTWTPAIYRCARVGTVSGTTISWGTESAISTSGASHISAAALSDSAFVVAYRDSGGNGTAIVGTVSDSTITWGTESEFNSGSTYAIESTALSGTTVVVAYQDVGNSDYGTAIVGTITGSTIAWGSESVFQSVGTHYISVVALSASKFVLAYEGGKAIVGNVSGSTITWGSESVFNSGGTLSISAAALSDTTFVVAYQDFGNSERGTAIVGAISGSTITWGSESVFNSAVTSNISAAALSDSKCVVAYRDEGNSNYGTAIVLSWEPSCIPVVVKTWTFEPPPDGWSYHTAAPPSGIPAWSHATSFSDANSIGLVAGTSTTTDYYGSWDSYINPTTPAIPWSANKLWRAIFTLSTSKASPDSVPSIRIRLSLTGMKAASYIQVYPNSEWIPIEQRPSTTDLALYMLPPIEDANGLFAAFDLIDFDRTAGVDGTVYVEEITVDTYDLTTCYDEPGWTQYYSVAGSSLSSWSHSSAGVAYLTDCNSYGYDSTSPAGMRQATTAAQDRAFGAYTGPTDIAIDGDKLYRATFSLVCEDSQSVQSNRIRVHSDDYKFAAYASMEPGSPSESALPPTSPAKDYYVYFRFPTDPTGIRTNMLAAWDIYDFHPSAGGWAKLTEFTMEKRDP